MKKFLLLSFITMFLFESFAHAQAFKELCETENIHQEAYSKDARYRANYDKTKALLREKGISRYKTVTTMSGTEYHIPVVVHIIHSGGATGTIYNPSDAQINSFIARINSGFNNTLDHSSVPGTYNSLDIPLRFYLAQRNETGCVATTGINRIDFSTNATYVASGVRRSAANPGVADATIKSLDHWNDLNYYNIYVVNKINGNDGTFGSYIAGYAKYPTLGGDNQEGMVVLATITSSTTSTTPIHELGHAFNLIHTFQGGGTSSCATNTSCATQGDGVCDTEPIYQSIPCGPTGNNPCTGVAYTGTQHNYLTYTSCRDRFTPGQSARMISAIDNIRTSYKNSAGIDAPPASLPTAIAPPTYTTANAGNTFNMGPMYLKLNSIEHTSDSYSYEGAGSVHYKDNTCNQSTYLVAGTTYPTSVKTETNPQKVRIYIDYNNDGTFGTTAPEMVMSTTGASGSVTHTSSITPPATAVKNIPLRMRVIADASSSTMSPTMVLQYGQAEDYTVTILGAPLPVIWRSISANLNVGQNIDVRWTTAMETNNILFEVEKSKDGINFSKIGSVKAIGNSTMPSNYHFEDQENISGYNYYRIKQIDIDNKASYSTIVSEVLQSDQMDIVIFPNPTRGELNMNFVGMSLKNNNVEYTLTDVNGSVKKHQVSSTSNANIQFTESIKELPSGMYFLQITVNGKHSVHKVLKQY